MTKRKKKLGGGIEWTGKTRWNPLVGCSKVTQPCKNCYAIEVATGNARRFAALVQARLADGKLTWKQLAALATVQASVDGSGWSRRAVVAWHKLAAPLLWTKPRLVFPNSMSDLMHESLDDETVLGLCGIMAHAREHTFQALTKRPERLALLSRRGLGLANWLLAYRLLERAPTEAHRQIMSLEVPGLSSAAQEAFADEARAAVQRDVDRAKDKLQAMRVAGDNVWWGTSVGSHEDLERFWPHLAAAHVSHRWLSIEPLLGEVRLGEVHVVLSTRQARTVSTLTSRQGTGCDQAQWPPAFRRVEWVVVGGESVQPGQTARPMPIAAAERIIADCQAAGVPVFFKQMGKETIDASGLVQIGERAKGVPYESAPDHLKVRQLPEAFLRYER